MIGHKLAIEQPRPRAAQRRDQPRQRHFGRIGHAAEHRFAAERAVKPHPVKPADQPVILPAFQRMSVAQRVQLQIARLDPPADPGIPAITARRGTGQQHLVKRGVAGDAKAPAPQRARQRVRQLEPVQRQDRAFARLHPEQFIIVAAVRHREDPAAIGQQQHGRIDHSGGGRTMHRGHPITFCAARGGRGGTVLPSPQPAPNGKSACRGVAQLVEHRSPKPRACGSSPHTPAIFSACHFWPAIYCRAARPG